MKIWTSEYVFNDSWETVAQAAWRKYPNPLTTSVIGVDVVERQLSSTGVLKTHRLMSTIWTMPSWVSMIVGKPRTFYASEHSEVDPVQKKMTLRSRNLSLCDWITIDEQLVYSVHPRQPSRTLLTQEAVITVKGLPMSDYLEGLVKGTCSANAQKGRQAMEWVISRIKQEASELGRAAQQEFHHQIASLS